MSVSPLDSATAPVLDTIADAHTALIDAVHGFDVLLEKAEPEIRAQLTDIREANQRQADDLRAFLIAQEREPSGDGSYMSAVHEAVVRTRSFFTDIDGDVLPAVADGERRLVSSYDDALEKLAKHMDELPRDIFDAMHTLLTTHRGEIEDTVSRLMTRYRALSN